MAASDVKQTPKKVMPVSPGRPKGVPNKTTALLKDAILLAAEQAGGKEGLVGYLKTQAEANPGPFMTLLGKVLPTQVTGPNDGPIQTQEVNALDEIHRRIAGLAARAAKSGDIGKLN